MSREYKPLTLPKLGWDRQTMSANFGKLVAEPLEPGFGVTLGNAMRRTLLGAIEGIMQIVLNIKQIVVKNRTNTPGKMRLSVSSPKTVTVADITCDEHLEIVNKDHVLAHTSQGGVLDIEFTVESERS